MRQKFCLGLVSLIVIFLSNGVFAQTPQTYFQKIRTFHTPAEFRQLTQGRVEIQRSSDQNNCRRYLAEEAPLLRTIKICVGNFPDYWLGTPQGAIHFHPFSKTELPGRDSPSLSALQDTPKFSFFSGKRWLPDDQVTGFGFDSDLNVVWIETPLGYSRLENKRITLSEKSKIFIERVRARHVRHGLTSDSRLSVSGDLSSNQMMSNDNDGLWTAMYVAAECFRYKVTGLSEARENARQGMIALQRLEAITGIPGFPARSFIKKGAEVQPQDGEWHDSSDGQWRWKGDTSSDEIVGHYFVYPIYFDLVADENEKSQLAAVLDRITNHILDNNYQLIDADGKRTRWGWWGPEVIWEDPDETGLRALLLLSHLRTAIHVTRSETNRAKFRKHYDDLISRHRYHLLTRNQKINIAGQVNHSDDELAFLAFYPLLKYETNPDLRRVYGQSLERAWRIERPERNPLWNFIYAVQSGSKEFDRQASLRTLQEIPMDLIGWTVTNSHRLDIPMDMEADRMGGKQALIVLPYSELPILKWNGNPYRLDGGDGGLSEDDGAYFLLPYWLGRYHKLIGE